MKQLSFLVLKGEVGCRLAGKDMTIVLLVLGQGGLYLLLERVNGDTVQIGLHHLCHIVATGILEESQYLSGEILGLQLVVNGIYLLQIEIITFVLHSLHGSRIAIDSHLQHAVDHTHAILTIALGKS